MSTDLDHLKQLVAQYAQARAELIEHPSYEAGCAPDRLLHRRDDVAIEVADAVVAQQLPQIAGELDVDTAVAAAVAWFRESQSECGIWTMSTTAAPRSRSCAKCCKN
ncbi:hypothetical protein DMP15_29795 [Pseudonocardia sp. UM4_GMWB1]|uniref:hypothetical protein n=1 Tax=Pseudonocardia sp. UM4_GMWB1 TaxID=2212989 RepID=UPI00307EAC6D